VKISYPNSTNALLFFLFFSIGNPDCYQKMAKEEDNRVAIGLFKSGTK